MIGNDNSGSAALIGVVILIVVVAVAIGILNIDADESASEQEQVETSERSSSPQIDITLKNDVHQAAVAVYNYAADNNGRFPVTNVEVDVVEEQYFPDDFTHPESGLPYTINQLRTDTHHLIKYNSGVCGEDGSIELSDSRRQYAFQIELTNGDLYCVDNR